MEENSLKKGDCIILEYQDSNYALILHHSTPKKDAIEYAFLIIGESFKQIPSKSDIESSGILGDKYQNNTTDLLNSMMRSQQKNDSTVFYTGVKYDVLTIPKALIDKEGIRIRKLSNVKLHPEFYPMPNFHSSQNDYQEICDLIQNRISKKDPVTIKWDTIYDAHPLKELLVE